ncbi:MAG: DoxX family protein [Pseudomonadota bacterium]
MDLGFLAPVGRVFLALLFIMSGVGKISDPAGMAAFIESQGLPGLLVWPTIVLEVGGGLLIALGLLARPTAFLLAGFCVVTGVLYHLVPGLAGEMVDQGEVTAFLKNVAIAGGFTMIVVNGPGRFSLGS